LLVIDVLRNTFIDKEKTKHDMTRKDK